MTRSTRSDHESSRLTSAVKRTCLPALIACAGALFVVGGCDRSVDETPEDALTAWVTAMNASRLDPTARERAYGLLASAAREQLAQRAVVAVQLSGRDIKPWEMLAPGQFALRFAFDRARLRSRIDGSRATVTARGPGSEVAEVPLVLEQGRWRVALELPAWVGPQRTIQR